MFEWGKEFQHSYDPIQYTLIFENTVLTVTGVARHYQDKECYFPNCDYEFLKKAN